jgi:hypothetical protein
MTEKYKCIRCGYETRKLGNLRNHINRISICEPLLGDINIKDQCIINEILNICNFCGKNYKKYNNKESHENSCIKKKEKEDKDELNKKLDIILTKLYDIESKGVNNTIITNNNNNIQNNVYNIQLLGYDSFTTMHVDRQWLFNNIVENKEEVSRIMPTFFRHVFLNDSIPQNHSMFCICMKKNENDVYVYTDERIVKGITVEKFYEFIDNDLKSRLKYLLNDKERIFLSGSYESLSENDKLQLSKNDYKDIKNSLIDFLCEKTKEFPDVLETLKQDGIPQTIAELHKQKSILMPNKAKIYLEYICE